MQFFWNDKEYALDLSLKVENKNKWTLKYLNANVFIKTSARPIRVIFYRFWLFPSSFHRFNKRNPGSPHFHSPPPSSFRAFSMLKLWRWYQKCLAVHPVKTQIVSSGFLWGLGDIGAQAVTQRTLRHQSQDKKVTRFPQSFFFSPFSVDSFVEVVFSFGFVICGLSSEFGFLPSLFVDRYWLGCFDNVTSVVFEGNRVIFMRIDKVLIHHRVLYWFGC